MIEPKASRQWFIRTGPLVEAAIKAVKEGDITIVPQRFTKVYFDWMENIRDWCISRQLWWGHHIPVWHCQDCSKLTASVDDPLACGHCGSNQIVQDPDVLDTWFSSALWTHSTLGWPEDTDDLRYFYPTSVMETGYDILFFWVARMIMMGLEDTGQIPFHTVYLHGLLRDEYGEKMSKLRGNVINPTEAISEYGVDALRFALIIGSSPGNDINLGKGRLKSSRNFANKLWNAARFIFQSIDAEALKCRTLATTEIEKPQGIEDRWIHSQLNRLITNVTKLMEDFQFGEAAQQIHDFIWSEFCDWYIEFAKIRLQATSYQLSAISYQSPLPFLANTLEISLRLLHPSMPFISEELWQSLKQRLVLSEAKNLQMPASIMIAPYPTSNEKAIDPEAERAMDAVIGIIRSIRNARSQYKVAAAKWIKAYIFTDDLLPYITSQAKAIETLARARPLAILNRQERKAGKEKVLILVLKEAEVLLPWTGMIDQLAEKKRLIKEKKLTQARIAQLNTRLRDNAFLTKAPPHIVEKEKQKLYLLKDKFERLKSELSQLD